MGANVVSTTVGTSVASVGLAVGSNGDGSEVGLTGPGLGMGGRRPWSDG